MKTNQARKKQLEKPGNKDWEKFINDSENDRWKQAHIFLCPDKTHETKWPKSKHFTK